MNRYTLTLTFETEKRLTKKQIASTRILVGEHQEADGMPKVRVLAAVIAKSAESESATEGESK